MQEYENQQVGSGYLSELQNRGNKFWNTVKRKTTELGTKAKEALANLAEKGVIATQNAKRMLKPFCRKVKMRLGTTWQNILDYRAPRDQMPDADCERYEDAAARSVLAVLEGPNPVQTFCNLDKDAKRFVLEEIHDVYCRAMGIPKPEYLVTDDLPHNCMGVYSYGHHVLLINSALFDEPMGYAKAQELIDTLIHEDFHAFQLCAMLDPERYQVPRNVARLWRDNKFHYITFEQNLVAYRLQPLEAYAWRVAGNAMALLRDKAYVQKVEAEINQKGEY